MKQALQSILILWSINCFSQQQTIKPGMNLDSFLKAKQIKAIGEPLGQFNTHYINEVFTNKNLLGKTVFINFWFAACAPCMAEFTELNKLYDTLKGNKNFEFISFTTETPKIISAIVKKYKINYKVFSLSEDDCGRLNRNAAFPTSIIIDPTGIIKLFRSGGPVNKEQIKNVIFNQYYPKILNELQLNTNGNTPKPAFN